MATVLLPTPTVLLSALAAAGPELAPAAGRTGFASSLLSALQNNATGDLKAGLALRKPGASGTAETLPGKNKVAATRSRNGTAVFQPLTSVIPEALPPDLGMRENAWAGLPVEEPLGGFSQSDVASAGGPPAAGNPAKTGFEDPALPPAQLILATAQAPANRLSFISAEASTNVSARPPRELATGAINSAVGQIAGPSLLGEASSNGFPTSATDDVFHGSGLTAASAADGSEAPVSAVPVHPEKDFIITNLAARESFSATSPVEKQEQPSPAPLFPETISGLPFAGSDAAFPSANQLSSPSTSPPNSDAIPEIPCSLLSAEGSSGVASARSPANDPGTAAPSVRSLQKPGPEVASTAAERTVFPGGDASAQDQRVRPAMQKPIASEFPNPLSFMTQWLSRSAATLNAELSALDKTADASVKTAPGNRAQPVAGDQRPQAAPAADGMATPNLSTSAVHAAETNAAATIPSSMPSPQVPGASSASSTPAPAGATAPSSLPQDANTPKAADPSGEQARLPQSAEEPSVVQTSPAGSVQVARMATAGAQAEMRIDLRTPAFGTVELHAVVHDSVVGMTAGSEKGDLRSFLAPELPALQASLRQQELRFDGVRFLAQGANVGGQFPGESGAQSRSYRHALSPAAPGSGLEVEFGPLPEMELALERPAGLNIHA